MTVLEWLNRGDRLPIWALDCTEDIRQVSGVEVMADHPFFTDGAVYALHFGVPGRKDEEYEWDTILVTGAGVLWLSNDEAQQAVRQKEG